MTLKQIWSEFRANIKDINIKHEACEYAIKAKIDSLTFEEWLSPMDAEMQTLWGVQEGMGGIRRVKIYFYAMRKYGEMKRNVRR